MACIRLQGVGKRFAAQTVLTDLNLTIEEGEFFTFVGPSGCGKSTVLNLIAGLEEVTSGDIRFDERSVLEQAPAQRDVAMVFQSYALYPHMTVADNIGFPLKVRGVPPPEVAAAVADVAEVLGLTQLLARRPKALSGGQRQRVALGRALVRRPAVFLMDEPLSNLDARLRLEMRAELKRLHTRYRITTVYVTHDQEEAMALSDRIAVLDQGRIQQCGTPAELHDDPQNLFVAGFIGMPPINVVPVERLAPWLAGERVPELDGALAGVRPRDVAVSARAHAAAVPAEVVLLEPTGNDLWAVLRLAGTELMGRASPQESLHPGGAAYVRVNAQRLFLFDAGSGQRLHRDRSA